MSFQVLGKLYAVLSDKEQRAVYDEQGVVDEESDVLSQDRCWEDYWRLLFPKVMTLTEGSDAKTLDSHAQLYTQTWRMCVSWTVFFHTKPCRHFLWSSRSQCRTFLNLRTHIKDPMRSGRMWSGFTCSTKETWTPSQPRLSAAPRKTSPGCAASSRLQSRAGKSKPSKLLLRRATRRRMLGGRGWELLLKPEVS